jgi:hypothetical protein
VAFETTAAIISDVAIDLGLVSEAIANPYTSTDPNILRLCEDLKRVGRQFVRAHPWSHLTTIYTFPTVDGTASYALPTDFNRVIDGTAWNRSTQSPMHGPLSAQEWEAEKARSSSSSAHQFFRIFGNLFYIHATPSSAETVAYEYVSRYWVDLAAAVTPDAETPTGATDTCFFDPDLLCAGLKLRFRSRGFDTTAEQREFNTLWAAITGADGAAPVLGIAGGNGPFRLLDGSNLPDSGVGD